MYIWNELSLPSGKQAGYKTMVGQVDSSSSAITNDYQGGSTLHIPLEFWFCRNIGLALPLIALTDRAKKRDPVPSMWAGAENGFMGPHGSSKAQRASRQIRRQQIQTVRKPPKATGTKAYAKACAG